MIKRISHYWRAAALYLCEQALVWWLTRPGRANMVLDLRNQQQRAFLHVMGLWTLALCAGTSLAVGDGGAMAWVGTIAFTLAALVILGGALTLRFMAKRHLLDAMREHEMTGYPEVRDALKAILSTHPTYRTLAFSFEWRMALWLWTPAIQAQRTAVALDVVAAQPTSTRPRSRL